MDFLILPPHPHPSTQVLGNSVVIEPAGSSLTSDAPGCRGVCTDGTKNDSLSS